MSDIYLQIAETPTVVTLSAPVISGALSSTVTVANTVTVALDANSLSALENVTVTVGAAVTISNFPATQNVAGTVTANAFGYDAVNLVNKILPICERNDLFSVTDVLPVGIAHSVTIGSLPAISGTVTVGNSVTIGSCVTLGVTIANTSVTVNGTFYQATQPVSLASLPALAAGTNQIGSVTASISGIVPVSGTFWQSTQPVDRKSVV